MDISMLQGIQQTDYISQALGQEETARTGGFDSVFASALNMLKETSDLQNKAEEMEIQLALGEADNAHDLQIAQQKANVSLQYTVAVKNTAVEAYRTLMNMQF